MFIVVGGFDTTYKRNEDLELAWRLRERGAQFVFNPRADVYHYAEHSLEKWRNAAYQYGRYDVLMERDKRLPSMHEAAKDFRARHVLNRASVRVLVGHKALLAAVVFTLGTLVQVADKVGASRPTRLALSAMFNLQYWQGVCDELGGRERLWQRLGAEV
jgi:hypothetical protein